MLLMDQVKNSSMPLQQKREFKTHFLTKSSI
uniref:Uncharacterized protein n=1 Tax=Arundo donax TaxID=35708 RepID=A0A0A9E8V7_ARUDO